jgi:hypothetical protein
MLLTLSVTDMLQQYHTRPRRQARVTCVAADWAPANALLCIHAHLLLIAAGVVPAASDIIGNLQHSTYVAQVSQGAAETSLGGVGHLA